MTPRDLGETTLSIPLEGCSEGELRDEVRELIYEDEERDCLEQPDEPRWDHMNAVLGAHGIAAGDRSLAALPFVIELEDDVLALLDPRLR